MARLHRRSISSASTNVQTIGNSAPRLLREQWRRDHPGRREDQEQWRRRIRPLCERRATRQSRSTDSPTIETFGAGADGAVADTGGAVSLMNGGQIVTSGTGASGVYTASGGSAVLSGVSVSTAGDSAPGLWASGVSQNPGPHRPIVATDVTVTTGVGPGPGTNAIGVLASAGGIVSLTGASIMTSGDNAPGIQATGSDGMSGGQSSGDNCRAHRRVANRDDDHDDWRQQPGRKADTGGQIMLTGGSVTTSGAGSTGLYATGTDGETGVPSTITATGVAVTTGVAKPWPAGTGATGVLAEAGGQVFLTDGSVTTYGNSAYAAVTHSGGLVQLNGTSISTNGDGSGGLGINGAGPRSTPPTRPFRPLAVSTPARVSIPMASTMARTGVSRRAASRGSRIRRSRRRARRCTASSLRLAARRRSSAARSATAGTQA